MTECPYCKKPLEVNITGRHPWWKNPVWLNVLVYAFFFWIILEFAKDIGYQKSQITRLENKIDNLATKLDALKPTALAK